MLVGTIGYVIIDDFPLMDAVYQTGITFTTVGFGEIAPISDAGRIFTITLIISGFAVFSSAVGILVAELNKGNIVAILKERSMLYSIARLKKHFHEWAKEHNYSTYLQAEPHAELTMLKAHLASAKGLITLSDSMSDNIALIASVRLFEKEHSLPRPYYIISSAESVTDLEKLKKLGADTVVSPTKLTAQRVSAMAARPDMENLIEEFLYKSDNPLDMEEIEIPKYSWAVLKKLKETQLRSISNTSIIGIRKKDGKFVAMPKGDVLITSESKLLIIGTQNDINTTKELLRRREKPKELKFV